MSMDSWFHLDRLTRETTIQVTTAAIKHPVMKENSVSMMCSHSRPKFSLVDLT